MGHTGETIRLGRKNPENAVEYPPSGDLATSLLVSFWETFEDRVISESHILLSY